MVRETVAIVRRGQARIEANDPMVHDFPLDFLAFTGSPIVFAQGAVSGALDEPLVLWGSNDSIDYDVNEVWYGDSSEGPLTPTGRWVELCVSSSRDLETLYGIWDSDPRVDVPHSIVVRSPRVCEVFPRPSTPGVVEFSYISNAGGVESAANVMEWVPFDSDPLLNEYAVTIAYKVASDLMVARNPEVAAYLRSLYEKDIRRMRHIIRYDPAKDIHVAPGGILGGSLYAPR